MANIVRFAIAAVLTVASHAATAQSRTAHEVGFQIAQRRGYANPECYARVFAKHAVVVERANGARGWYAASTPAYNADQRLRCGVDRLAERRPSRPAPGDPTVPQQMTGDAYRAGQRIARQRGYSGAAAACFARVFAGQARLAPSSLRAGTISWSAAMTPSIRGEMHRQCGISV